MLTSSAIIKQLEAVHLAFQVGALDRLYPGLGPEERPVAVGRERMRDAKFVINMRNRVKDGVKEIRQDKSLTPDQKETKIALLTATELRYLRQHINAATWRLESEADMTNLKAQGEKGAYWKLGVARNHTEDCVRMAGKWWPWPVLEKINPANRHTGCFPGTVVVSGPRAHSSTTRWFEGELVDVILASGRHLPVTPNHPILTTAGWVAAGLLHKGDRVLCGELGKRPFLTRPDDEDIPTMIKEVAESRGRDGAMPPVAMPTSSEDFHGDGGGSEIHVVRTEGLLRLEVEAITDERLELAVERRLEGSLALQGQSTAARHVVGKTAALAGLMGRRELALPLLLSHAGPVERGGLALASNGDSSVTETSGDRATREANLLRELLRRVAEEVSADKVGAVDISPTHLSNREPNSDPAILQSPVDGVHADTESMSDALRRLTALVGSDDVVTVSRRQFAGHVYNLETDDGWYIANGILVHNCKCKLVSRADAERQGLPVRLGRRTASVTSLHEADDTHAEAEAIAAAYIRRGAELRMARIAEMATPDPATASPAASVSRGTPPGPFRPSPPPAIARNAERDARICEMWAEEGLGQSAIGRQVGLTQPRVRAILLARFGAEALRKRGKSGTRHDLLAAA